MFYEKPYEYIGAGKDNYLVLPIKLPLERKPIRSKPSQDIKQYLEMNLGQSCMKVPFLPFQ